MHPVKIRLPAAERRTAIVDSAINLFAQRGFRGTTTRELAAAAGISEPVLYQHFETKRALFDAILEAKSRQSGDPDLAERIRAASAAGDNPAFFTLLAEALIDWYTQDPRYARLLMFAALEGHELSQMFFDRAVTAFYTVITGHIQRQIEAGRFRSGNPLLAARLFAGMVAHQGVVFAIYCPGHLPASREEIVRSTVDIFLRGITQ